MNIQETFPFVSKADWLAQIQKDLKGSDPSTLVWQLNERITVDPLVAATDFPVLPQPLSDVPGEWDISEIIVVAGDPEKANQQALEALQLGAQNIHFQIDTTPDASFLATLLDGIYLDFAGLHFEGAGVAGNPGAVLALLTGLAAEKGIPTQSLRGSLGYAPDVQVKTTDWRYLGELIEFAKDNFPQFRIIHLQENTSLQPDESLADLLHRSAGYLKNLSERGFSPQDAARAIQFSCSTRTSYFVEIARLRAFRMLWLNFLQAWGLEREYPSICAGSAAESYTDDIYTNMVRATTMAMSAALGGANQIIVRPYDADRAHLSAHSESFARRIARNVQHLLKMESGLDKISDPAAGSYYIEQLTRQIGVSAWELFKKG